MTNHSVGALRCRTFVARSLGGRSELAAEGPLVDGSTAEAGSAPRKHSHWPDTYLMGLANVGEAATVAYPINSSSLVVVFQLRIVTLG